MPFAFPHINEDSLSTSMGVLKRTLEDWTRRTEARIGGLTSQVTGLSNKVSTLATTTSGGGGGQAYLVSIGISPLNPSIILGTNIQFVATGYYSDGSAQNITSTATWTSSDTTVATLSATGYATSVGVGNTTIEAAVGTINNATVLTITPSGLATAYRPSTAVDTGDTVTSSPALAYDASISTYATVFSTYSNPLGGDLLREEGICTWSGFPTVILAAPSSLNILIATDFTGNSRGYVQVSINGSVVQSYYATTALVNIVYPLSAGTNISTYTVGIRSHCTDGGAIHTGGEIDANIYEIYIPH